MGNHLGAVAGVLVAISAIGSSANSATIALSSATATYTQPGGWYPSTMIDGIFSGTNGWAINEADTNTSHSQTALFVLATPLPATPQNLTFTIYQNFGASHLIGDFILAYTTDAIPTLGGDQTPFTLTGASSLDSGTTFTTLGTGHLLTGGDIPDTDTYTITTSVDAPITGIYLDAINDPENGLPFGGPGHQPTDGNFVISEFTVTTPPVPEPATWAMMIVGIGFAGASLRRRAASVHA